MEYVSWSNLISWSDKISWLSDQISWYQQLIWSADKKNIFLNLKTRPGRPGISSIVGDLNQLIWSNRLLNLSSISWSVYSWFAYLNSRWSLYQVFLVLFLNGCSRSISKSDWVTAMIRNPFSFPSPYKYSLIIVVSYNIACSPSHLRSAPKSNYCDSALVEPLTIYLFCCLI